MKSNKLLDLSAISKAPPITVSLRNDRITNRIYFEPLELYDRLHTSSKKQVQAKH